jgi:glycosyltransferase involved in cell wall biosynthesis
MRVLMVSKALVVGAYQRKLEELARLPGIELVAVVPPMWREGAHRAYLERAHTSGYEMVAAPVALNGKFHLHYYPTLGRLLTHYKPQILHMDEEPYNLATWHALRLGEAAKSRSLFFTWQNLERHYPWPFRGFELVNYRRARHAIAGNRTAVQVLRNKGYGGPISVIPQFGVDPSLFIPAGEDETRPENRSLTIGYAGRLVREKGLDVLLHACAIARLPSWRLLVRGDGPMRPQLEALAHQLDISAQVQFLGKMPSTEMAAFYRSLDIFVLPSLTRPNWAEQFARVLIEAMACAVPILGSGSGEIPDVLGDGGLVFPEGDACALAELLHKMALDRAEREKLGKQGRARVLGRFTQQHIAAATADVYRSMLEARI